LLLSNSPSTIAGVARARSGTVEIGAKGGEHMAKGKNMQKEKKKPKQKKK